jgi:uncharacterized protein YjbJ (UPF0337 family)
MGIVDKFRNKVQEVRGQTKEAEGNRTHDTRLQAEGKKDKAAAKAKGVGERAKDAL